jgi:DNA invertase Pin-like site-specific DNA recombinase
MRIGYGRLSTRDQNHEAQHDALHAAGCERIFIDHASGKLATRPELDKALLCANRAGDQLVVTKLDRLGRSLEHLIELSKLLHALGEFEHALMRERTMDGLAATRARGRTGGQKPKLSPRQTKLVREAYDRRDCTVAEIAADFGVTRQTVYRALKKTETGATLRV